MGKFDTRATFGIDFKVNKTELETLKRDLASLKSITPENLMAMNKGLNLNEAKKQLAEIKNYSTQVQQALSNAFNTDLGVLNINRLHQELRKLPIKDIYTSFSQAGAAGQNAFNTISSAILKSNLQLKESHALLDKIGTTFSNTIRFGLASSVFNRMTDSIQRSWEFTKQLDTSLNDIRIVTGKSADEMERYAKVANKAAQNLGATTQDYVKSSLIYYQQGLSDEETQARSDVTIKTANVTGQNASTVSEQLTAIWNGYKVSAEEAELYIDKVAKVAATTAADLEEMATGMSKVASAANSAGVDIDQLNAMLATVISVTREAPETIGTSFRTIFARLGDLQMGKTDEDGVGLGKVSSQISELGVEILDQSGNMRDMGDIIEDIAAKWQDLSQGEKQALAVAAAGKQQYSRFIALFDNWDMYTKALNDSKTATGELQKQQDTYMESTKAHLDKLTAAQERVGNAFIDNKGINSTIDAISLLTNSFANFIESLGGGGNFLLTFGAIATKVFNKQIAQGINGFIKDIQNAKDNTRALELQVQDLQWMQTQIGGQGKDLGLDTKITEKQRMQKYIPNMSIESINKGNTLIDDLGNAISKEQQYNQSLEETLRIIQQISGQKITSIYSEDENTNSYLDDPDAQEKFQNYVSEWENLDNNIQIVLASMDGVNDAMNKANENGQETQKTMEQRLKYLSTLEKALDDIGQNQGWLKDSDFIQDMSEDSLKNLKTAIEKIRELSNKSFDDMTAEEEAYFRSLLKNVNDFSGTVRERLRNAQETIDTEDSTRGQQANHNANDSRNKQQNLDIFIASEERQAFIQDITNATSAVMTLTSAYQSLTNLPKIWTNEDLTVGEKIVQTLMSLGTVAGTVLPMVISAYGALADKQKLSLALDQAKIVIEGEKSVAAVEEIVLQNALNRAKEKGVMTDVATIGALTAEQKAHLLNSFATVEETAAIGAAKVAQDSFNASVLMNPYVWIAIAVIAAVAAIAFAVKAAADEQNKYNQQLEDAQQRYEALKTEYEDMKTAYDSLKSSIEDYQGMTKALSVLTKGTNEWYEQVAKINDAVLKLIDTYPSLVQYMNQTEDGVLEISEDGYKAVIKQQQQQVRQKQVAMLHAQQDVYYASQTAAIDNFRKDNKFMQYGSTREKMINGDYYDKQTSREDLNKGLDKIANLIANNKGDFAQGKLDDEILAIGKELGVSDMIGALDKNRDKLLSLSTSLTGYQSSIDQYSVAILTALGQDIPDYVNSDNKDLINKNTQKDTKDNYQDAKNEVNNMSNEQLAEYWINNLSPDDVQTVYYKKHRFFNEGSTLEYTQDGTKKKVDLETLKQQVASDKAAKKDKQDLLNNTYGVNGTIDALNYYNSGLGTFMKDIGAGNDVTKKYSKEEIERYKQIWEEYLTNVDDVEREAVEKFVGKTNDLSTKISNAYDNGKTKQEIIDINRASFNPKASKYNDSAVAVQEGIQSGDITYENIKDNEDYKNLISSLDELKKAYPEVEAAANILNETWLVGTQEYAEALEEVQNKLYQAKIANLTKTANDTIDGMLEKAEGQEVKLAIDVNSSDFESTMDEILNAEYAIDIAIHTEAEKEFENIVNAMNNIHDQAAKIGDDFIVSANDVRELNNTFPGIIQNMKALGDGTVQLNKEVVASAMGMAEAEVAADSQATIAKLKNQANLLRQKQVVYSNMAQAASILAEMEVDTDDAAADQKAIISENLAKLQGLNDELQTQTEMDNDELVANASQENGGVVARNWSEAYQSAAESSYKFATTAVANMKAAAGEGSPVAPGDFGVNYTGASGKSSEAKVLEGTQSLLDDTSGGNQKKWAEIAQKYQMMADSAGAAANDIDGMIAQIGAQNVELRNGLQGVKTGKGIDNKKNGSSKDPDKMDKLESDVDRYHKVNAQLDKISNQLDKIQSQEKKFIGTKLINNLNGQLEKLDKRIDNLREKQKIAYGEADELKQKLSTGGVTFNDDGTIANYMEMYNAKLNYVNGLIDQYNNMSADEQEKFKDVIEQAKKDFDKWQEDMDRYDELVSDFIPGLENDIQDAIDEEIELNIKKFNLEFEVKLDIADAQKDWNEFKRKILDDIDDDDILGNARARATDDLGVYLAGTDGKDGLLGAGLKQTESILKELKDMDEKGWSNVYGDDRVSALEDLQEAYQNVEQSLMEIKEIQEDVAQAVLDQMDAVADAMDKVADLMDTVDSQIEHDIKVIEMVYGETDYDAKAKYMEKRQQNNLDTLGTARENRDFWEQEMNLIDDKTSEAYQKAQENFFKYNDAVNDAIEKSIEDAQEKAENAIDGIFKKYNDEITNGKGLDYTEQQWELVNDVADQYLDTVNAAFGIRQLEGKWKDAIDQTDNVGAQRKLNALMEEQLKKLREKDKLTEYDIERAEKEYEIALKKLALEEAQQTKSTMRLRRDSQGNYRYEYVADEDQIAKLQDELDVLENSLYNFDKERWLEMQNQVVDAVRDRQDAIKEILMDASLTEEERLERLEEINKLYNEKIQNITDQAVTAQTNLYDSGATEIAKIWDEEGKDFQALSDEEKRILVEEMLPQFETGVNDMIDKFSGPDGFEETTVGSMEELSQATQDYQNDLGDVEDQAGITFDEIRDGQDDVLDKMPDMIDDAEDYVDVMEDELGQLQDINAELQKKLLYYQQISTAAKAAATEAYNYWLKEQQIAAEKYAQENAKKNDNAGGNNGNTGSGGNGSSGSGSGGKATLSAYDAVGVAAAISLGQNYGGWGVGQDRANKLAAKFTNDNDVQAVINRNNGYKNSKGEFNAYKDKLENYYYNRFNTGGYTGDWVGDYGKFAMLDRKELVLNAHDTENMLDMLAITRDVVAMSGPRSGLARIMTPSADSDVLEQNVHIEANFPNAESAEEIKEAINSLVNLAAQRASRNGRG